MSSKSLIATSKRVVALGIFATLCFIPLIHVVITGKWPTWLPEGHAQIISAGLVLVLFLCCVQAVYALLRKDSELTNFDIRAKQILARREHGVRLDEQEFREMQRAARLVNNLMAQIDDSLETRRSLAELDNLILSGADLTSIIRRCLLAARISDADVFLVLRTDDEEAELFVHQLEGLSVTSSVAKGFYPSEQIKKMTLASHYEELVHTEYNNVLDSYVIACEEQPIGALFACGKRPLAASESKRLEDLVDRMSVALTNIKRSETLYNQANFDPLTGLVNRRAFEERLRESLFRSRRDEMGVVLFMDLDGFKKVNDTAGHETGDVLLTRVAAKIRDVVRPEDTVARLGGDEFAVIARNCSQEQEISALCNRVIESLTSPVMINRTEHTIGTSIGVARYPDDGTEVDELVTKADSAMYKAKQEGGSQFAFFDDSLKAANDHRVLVESRLRAAIKQNALDLHFQPKLNLASWRIDSAEALIRWDDAELGNVPPDEFIGVAEESRLIQDMFPIIVNETADMLAKANLQGVDIDRVAINASAKQIMSDDFALGVLSMLDAQHVRHDQIELEVTESVFAQDLEKVLTQLDILRMAGIKIALDDFGTGYSSLNMLRELPLDIVKIDRTFVTEIDDSEQARSMLKHLLDIARVLNLQVVAEGVETDMQLSMLSQHASDYVQGWQVAKAMPIQEFLDFVKEWGAQSSTKIPSATQSNVHQLITG